MAYTPIDPRSHLPGGGFNSFDSLRFDSMPMAPRTNTTTPSGAGGQPNSGGLSSRLDQQLSCAICLERYYEPRVLRCSHSFCRLCLEQLRKQRVDDPENPQPQNHLTCPKCRYVTVLSELGVDALPINWDLMQVVEIVDEEEGDILDPTLTSHTSSQLPSLIPSPSLGPTKPTCREHNRLLDYFCEQCNQVVCATCAINIHGGHKPKEAQYLMDELRSKCLDPLEIRYLKTNVSIDENTRTGNQLRKLGESHKHQVQKLFQEIRNALNSREQVLIQAIDGIVQKKCTTLGTQCTQLQQLRDKLLDEKDSVARLLQIRDSDYTVLLKRDQIVAEVDAVVAEMDKTSREPVEKLEDGPQCVLKKEIVQEASNLGEVFCTPCPGQFLASGPGLEKAFVAKEAEFVVEAYDKYSQRAFVGGHRVEVTITDPQGAEIPSSVTHIAKGKSVVKYVPGKVGFHTVAVSVEKEKIANALSNVVVYGCRDYAAMMWPRVHLSRHQIPDMSTVKSVCVLPSSGNLAFTDQLCVRVVNFDGRLIKRSVALTPSSSGQFNMPIGLTANFKDEIFVADRQTKKIQRISPEGRVVAMYGGPGNKPGCLNHPESVAVTTDRLFVVDTGNYCVQMLTFKTGKFKVIGGRDVPTALQLMDPQGVAIDEVRDRLYITDSSYNCLLCVSLTTFEPVTNFGQCGEVPLNSPTSVAVDRDGFLLVTSPQAHTLTIVSPQGAKVKTLGADGTLFKSPTSVTVDGHGNVIVADMASPSINIF